MGIPKSGKLMREMAGDAQSAETTDITVVIPSDNEPIKIREIKCSNEFVAVLPMVAKSSLQLPVDQYKNEGIVVGVGPGLPANDGKRCPSQFKVGDMVMFQERSIVHRVKSDAHPYTDKLLFFLSERNILCIIPHNFKIEIVQ